ncbi:unnamed protein product, partial [Amoebophrya sp. A25]
TPVLGTCKLDFVRTVFSLPSPTASTSTSESTLTRIIVEEEAAYSLAPRTSAFSASEEIMMPDEVMRP